MRARGVAAAVAALALCQGCMPAAPAIYSSDPADPWNRIFAVLFTRTVKTSKTSEFADAGPFVPAPYPFPSYLRVQVSTRTFDRYEDGDRALEAFYPSFITRLGIDRALSESAALARALNDAYNEHAVRPALHRALMQSDLWSAYDALARDVGIAGARPSDARREQAAALLPRLARLIGKLALPADEIARLPDNYAAARSANAALPDLFAADGPWMEVVRSPHRMHDDAADFRRASRVFIRPVRRPDSESRFLGRVGDQRDVSEIAATALVMQLLVVDSKGQVVPTRLVSDAQIRTFARDGRGALRGDVDEYELSRRRLIDAPSSGGFVHFGGTDPAYLPLAGNDYGFATPARDSHGETAPILATLATRCSACHGPNGATFMTFNLIPAPDGSLPPIVRLHQPNDDRGRDVAARKETRDDFRSLLEASGLRR